MGIPDIYVPFNYRGLDFGITIQSYAVSGDGEVEIEDYEISMDCADGDTPSMINSMLSDGRHLQSKILDSLTDDDMDRVIIGCVDAWEVYWSDVADDRGLDADCLV